MTITPELLAPVMLKHGMVDVQEEHPWNIFQWERKFSGVESSRGRSVAEVTICVWARTWSEAIINLNGIEYDDMVFLMETSDLEKVDIVVGKVVEFLSFIYPDEVKR